MLISSSISCLGAMLVFQQDFRWTGQCLCQWAWSSGSRCLLSLQEWRRSHSGDQARHLEDTHIGIINQEISQGIPASKLFRLKYSITSAVVKMSLLFKMYGNLKYIYKITQNSPSRITAISRDHCFKNY